MMGILRNHSCSLTLYHYCIVQSEYHSREIDEEFIIFLGQTTSIQVCILIVNGYEYKGFGGLASFCLLQQTSIKGLKQFFILKKGHV